MSRADRFVEWAYAVGEPSPPQRQGPSRRIAAAVPVEARPALRRLATAAQHPLARRRATRIAATVRPLRLHLGCGPVYKSGWINVDLVGTRVDLAWDLARPLPFAPGSVEAIFHEHLLEHLTYAQGLELNRRCRELLRAGGVLRIGVPDAGAALSAYAEASAAASQRWPTALGGIAALAYGHGHGALYDAETLELSCVAAGFGTATRRAPGEGELQPCPDSERRRDHTLYVEATA